MDQTTTFLAQIQALQVAAQSHDDETKALRHAAQNVGAFITDMCDGLPSGTVLPRGYVYILLRSNVGTGDFLAAPEGGYVDGYSGYLHGDFRCPTNQAEDNELIRFGKDIAEGLIGEIAAFMAERTAQLVAAKEALAAASS